MKQLAILADDLSSATDCGIQIAHSGLQTRVIFGEYQPALTSDAVDVVSLNTDSRSLPVQIAYERMAAAAHAVWADGYRHIYKSMDSTLRGNLGAEVDAVLDSTDFEFAAIAPAFPHYGRTTLNGQHFLNGIPINQTEFARDPQCPVTDADLVHLFSSQSKYPVGLLDLPTLRGGRDLLCSRLKALISAGARLVVLDAQVEEDLDLIVDSIFDCNPHVLWVGSTGMARCIPHTLRVEKREGIEPARKGNPAPGLLVIGSVSEVTRAQLAECLKDPAVISVPLDPFKLITGEEEGRLEMKRCYRLAERALKSGRDAVLYVSSTRADVPAAQALGRTRGMGNFEVAARIVDALGLLTRKLAQKVALSGIIMSGGDTARAACVRLETRSIEILQEVEPGIPLCHLEGAISLPMITKAGAFGSPGVLTRALKLLKEV